MEAERRPGRVRDPRIETPGPIGDHRLDQDPVPAASEADPDRVLVQRGGADDVMAEHRGAVDPDLDRPGRSQAQGCRPIAIAAHERHDVGGRLIGGTEQAIQVQDAVAHTGITHPPADVVRLARVVGAQLGRGRFLLRGERGVQAGATFAERPDDEAVRQQAQRRAQRRGFAGLTALLEEVRQQPRRLRRDQRMRALGEAAPHRGFQRARVDVLLQRRERGERARPLDLRRVRREPGGFIREQLVVRVGRRDLRLRGARADDGDRAEHQRRRSPANQHGRRDYSGDSDGYGPSCGPTGNSRTLALSTLRLRRGRG